MIEPREHCRLVRQTSVAHRGLDSVLCAKTACETLQVDSFRVLSVFLNTLHGQVPVDQSAPLR